ncbi:hypothetical protein FGO68_gene14567 [Halteria grandinella]|uniref:Uncharacterized protein n=1 Tax=Halteria grandinella TaxID=5974 RepID=A0A8J8T4W5_HALGN|nr:hypothetical protein FGO68_gene14567 [Halteria grandinella]
MSLFYPIGGFDIMRLHYPSVDQLNEDFICGISEIKLFLRSPYLLLDIEIVLNPLQCSNQQCSALYCKTCLDNNEKQSGGVSKCKLCAKVYPGKQQREAAFMQPSKLILKMLDDYQIQCQHCKKPFPVQEHNLRKRALWYIARLNPSREPGEIHFDDPQLTIVA